MLLGDAKDTASALLESLRARSSVHADPLPPSRLKITWRGGELPAAPASLPRAVSDRTATGPRWRPPPAPVPRRGEDAWRRAPRHFRSSPMRQQQVRVRDDVRRRSRRLRRRLAPQLALAPQLRARALPRWRGLVRAAAPLLDIDFINARAPVLGSEQRPVAVVGRLVDRTAQLPAPKPKRQPADGQAAAQGHAIEGRRLSGSLLWPWLVRFSSLGQQCRAALFARLFSSLGPCGAMLRGSRNALLEVAPGQLSLHEPARHIPTRLPARELAVGPSFVSACLARTTRVEFASSAHCLPPRVATVRGEKEEPIPER